MCSVVSRPVVRLNVFEQHVMEQSSSHMTDRKQREKRRDREQDTSFQGTSTGTYFLLLGSISFHHLPMMPSYYESIRESIY
jgi:hypothetical protein